jgi:hypothetical protein
MAARLSTVSVAWMAKRSPTTTRIAATAGTAAAGTAAGRRGAFFSRPISAQLPDNSSLDHEPVLKACDGTIR